MNDQTSTSSGPAEAEEETAAAAAALIPQLPNDISLQIIARIPRWQHPYLSLISKSWRSTLLSPDLFLTRSLLHTTYQSLYLNLRLNNNNHPFSSFHWHLLHQTNNINNNRFLLSPLPPNSSQPIGSAFAVIPPKFYLIGGSLNGIPSNNIWVFDCCLNQWSLGPRMRVAREFAAAGVVDGKIYVMGGCVSDCFVKSMNWCEVLDPVIGAWMPVASPVGVKDKWMHASCVMDGRIYAMADRGGVVYDAVVGEWGNGVPKRLDLGWRGRGAVVDMVLYCYDFLGKIRGYNVEKDRWEELSGVDKSLPKFLCGATMVSLNGRLCVVWERKGGKKEVEIMCAEIDVWKDEGGGLNGSVLCSDVILRIPFGSSIVHCLAVDF